MSLPKIFFWVFLGHVTVLTMLAFTQKRAHFPTPKKMVVSTVMEKRTFQEKVYVKKEPKKIVKKEEKKEEKKVIEKKLAAEKEKPAPLDKKIKSEEKIIKKENKNVVKEISKKSAKSIKNETKDVKKEIVKKETLDLLEQVSNLEKIPKDFQTASTDKLHVPKLGELTAATIDIEEMSQMGEKESNAGFQNVLIDHFRKNLSLPEYGEVKVKLTLNADGTIVDVDVLSSKNKKNEEYLKNTLPNLTFPWFNLYLPNEKKLVLTISFLNEM
jgi:outer membrane biosynthesis protein TonB